MCLCKAETAKLPYLAVYVTAGGNWEGSSAIKCIIAGGTFVCGWCNFEHPILYFSEGSTCPVPSPRYQRWHLISPPCHEISHLCCVPTGEQGWSELDFPAIALSTTFYYCNTLCCNSGCTGESNILILCLILLLLWVRAVRAVSLTVCDVSGDGSQTVWVFSRVSVTRRSSTGLSLSSQRSRSGWSEAFPKSSRSVSNWLYKVDGVSVSRLNVLLVPVGYVELGAVGRFLQLIEFFLAGLILDIGSER